MKDTGMFRVIDELGRVVIPKEIRKSLKIEPGSELGIHVEGDTICLRPLKIQCVVCGDRNEERHTVYRGVHLCPVCLISFRREEGKSGYG